MELLQRQYDGKGIAAEVGDIQEVEPMVAYRMVLSNAAKAFFDDGDPIELATLAELAGVEIEDPADADPTDADPAGDEDPADPDDA